ncbi:histidine kinase [Luteibacter aegosomaticola]|uniref:sensor histidine kinase n=1 Tax=Luteibacter aegosomaticola TaxID=2911538 RepID=UPI001FFA5067|nr:sensor histidine kinase [Luteibacter aegosomaticola]UPG88115.1 histidine kinase [Luteibacter aegosomaticola]
MAGRLLASGAPVEPIGLSQWHHSVVMPGGEPVGYISALAQDRDGFLWLSTIGGRLLRFDGQELNEPFAEQLKPFQAPVLVLLGPHGESSDIWVGHRRGGATHIVNGVATHYEGGALPAGSVFVLQRDRRGVVWAVTPLGVARFVDGSWQPLPASFGWSKPHPESLVIESATGDVYVKDAEQGALVSRRGEAPFQPVSRSDFDRANAGLPPGVPWSLAPEDDGPGRFAPDGAFWYGPTEGIDHYRWSTGTPAGVPDIREHMGFADGLSGVQVMDILADREGDVWLATEKGLDRFRRTHFTPVAFDSPMGGAILLPMPDGSVWVANKRQPPYLYAHGKLTRVDALKDGVSAVTLMSDGSVMFAGMNGLRRWHGGEVTFLPVPPLLEHAGTRFKQVLEDSDGSLWITVATFGLYHVSDGKWVRMNGSDGLPDASPLLMQRLPGGHVGFAFADGQLLSMVDGRARPMPGSGHLDVGAPLVWLIDGEDMWLGGSSGLAHISHGVPRILRRAGQASYNGVTGLARDATGSVWVFDHDGVDRVVASADPAADGRSLLHIAPGEGISENSGVSASSSLVLDRSGMVWVASSDSVATLDPSHPVTNAIKPRVVVEGLSTDQQMHPVGPHDVVPALTHTVRIDYTAAMLRWPERTRFEYWMSGVDDTWQRAGTRRSAYYTNLSPGRYTFRVRAFNEDGVGSEIDAVYAFRVAPAWYQMALFRGLAVLLIVALAWFAYVYRVRELTRRMRIRTDERERIARDLHDTLLQGFQGLVLRFQAIRQHVESEKARDMIDRALARADDVLIEGRDKVTALRGTGDAFGSRDLVEALEAVGAERADLSTAAFRVVRFGRARELSADALENVLAIGREAALNAFQHAAASTVTVEVRYGFTSLAVRVVDNGHGFDPASERDGHWGLRGMGERARGLGAEFFIRSAPGEGAEVSVRVKAARAYL